MNALHPHPVGLVVVIIITGIFATFGIVAYGIGTLGVIAAAGEVDAWIAVGIILNFALSVAEAVIAHGLWNYERWGLKLAKFVYLLEIILACLGLYYDSAAGREHLIELILVVCMLLYISTRNIAILCGAKPARDPQSNMEDDEPTLKTRDHFID